MTNKELAVQLYSAIIQSSATAASNPNCHDRIILPSINDAVAEVAQLAEKLSHIEDK